MLPRISPQKEDKHARRLEKQSQLCQRAKKEPRRHIKIEYEKRHEDSSRDDKKTEDVAAKKRKKDKSTSQTQGSTWQPPNWREQLANIREMRKTRDAPVDSQGCEKTADESQSPEVRGDEIGSPVGWGKGRSDTVVSSETSKLIYER